EAIAGHQEGLAAVHPFPEIGHEIAEGPGLPALVQAVERLRHAVGRRGDLVGVDGVALLSRARRVPEDQRATASQTTVRRRGRHGTRVLRPPCRSLIDRIASVGAGHLRERRDPRAPAMDEREPHPVTAPSLADDTRRAYLANTPVSYRGAGGVQCLRRSRTISSLTSRSSRRAPMSKEMPSPSRTAAIGPPRAASGATCPAISPCVAPENRPSVSSATWSPIPCPTSAAVTASISRMPGPPHGPS